MNRTSPWQASIVLLGGADVDPTIYPSFPTYCMAVGVKYVDFSREVLAPPSDTYGKWTEVGQPSLQPIQEWWPRLASVLMLFTRLRLHVNEPVGIRHAFRPVPWNGKVGGRPGSDHLEACALDLVFRSNDARLRALSELARIWRADVMHLSIGTRPKGQPGKKLHVGLCAPRTIRGGRQRQWTYPPGGVIW